MRLSGPSGDGVDHNGDDARLVHAAVVEQLGEPRAIGRLGALALLAEHLPDLPTLSVAEGAARLLLPVEGVVPDLLLAADADVHESLTSHHASPPPARRSCPTCAPVHGHPPRLRGRVVADNP